MKILLGEFDCILGNLQTDHLGTRSGNTPVAHTPNDTDAAPQSIIDLIKRYEFRPELASE